MEATPERKPPNRGIEVKLLGHSPDPVRSLYLAYRTAYSALTPIQINDRIEDERITRETMLDFIEKRLETGHASPLEQVWFEFGIAGVTRAFSHQFVRHHMGISFEQQSQRYVTFKGGEFPYTVPESIKRLGLDVEYEAEFEKLAELYDKLIEAGVPAEDARFVLPNAANTNFKITVNFLEFLHIADLRLCTRAQWEFRKVVALMRREVMSKFPELAQYLQPKCGQFRTGYCDEPFNDWLNCPLGGKQGKRPHKDVLFRVYEAVVDDIEKYVPEYKSRPKHTKPIEEAEQADFFGDLNVPVEPTEVQNNAPDEYVRMQDLNESDFLIIEDEDSSVGR